MEQLERIEQVIDLYVVHGDLADNSGISHRAHAAHTASLARHAGATDELVVTALLHDVGQLVDAAADAHEVVGASLVARLFAPIVSNTIALHGDAKRWRSAVDCGYVETLAASSLLAVARHGGPLEPAGCERFEADPYSLMAIHLSRWDDAAHRNPDGNASFDQFVPLLHRLARCSR